MSMVPTLARRSLRARIGRSIFIGLSILAGVAFVSGSFILADSLKGTFDNLIDGLTGETDLQVRSVLEVDELDAVRDPLPQELVSEVADVPGVAVVEGSYGRYAQMLDPDGDPVTTQGAPTLGVSWDPDSGLSGVVLKEGRAPQGVDEVAIDKATADRVGYMAHPDWVSGAQAAVPGFAIDDENAQAVAEICARLDGLPLAIELAAARLKLLSPQAMLARLSRSLDLLRGGARDLPLRQQTLRQAIAWSYDLLNGEEQALFRRLAVFTGGFTLEAAEAVCPAAGGFPADPLDGIAGLMDKSLLRRDATPGDDPRFRMLETIREFGAEVLSACGEAADARRAHAAYFLALAERAAPELTGRAQAAWLDRLEADQDNLRAALGWANAQDDAAKKF